MHAWIDVDLRAGDSACVLTMRHALERLVQHAAQDESARDPTRALHAHITTLGDRPAGMIDHQHPLVLAAASATRAVGRTPQSASASTDANVPLARGIPAIAIGAGGSGGGAHTADEWFDDADSEIGLDRVIRLVVTLGTATHLFR